MWTYIGNFKSANCGHRVLFGISFQNSFGFLLRIIPVLCPTSCFYLPTSCRVVKWDVVHSAGIILKWNLNEFWKEIPKCTRFPQSAVHTEAHLLFSWLSRISGQEGLWGRLRTGKSWEHIFFAKSDCNSVLASEFWKVFAVYCDQHHFGKFHC